jgi:hypothetical protein
MNTRHDVLYWFGLSRGVIAIHLVLMYYTIKIGSSLFSFGIFRGLLGDRFGDFSDVSGGLLDVDISSLFIIEEPSHRV